MEIGSTSITSLYDLVPLLCDEIDPVLEKLAKKYCACNVALFFVFRVEPEKEMKKSSARYIKKENCLYLSIGLNEDRYKKMIKDEQRYDMSHKFFDLAKESLKKYKFPGLDTDAFLKDLEMECKEIGWLKEEWEVELWDEHYDPRHA